MKWPHTKFTQKDPDSYRDKPGHSMPACRNAGTTACRHVSAKKIINT